MMLQNAHGGSGPEPLWLQNGPGNHKPVASGNEILFGSTLVVPIQMSQYNPAAARQRTGTAWETRESGKMSTEITIPPAPVELSEEAKAELELVNRAREGDGSAFSALIRQYEGKIFRLAMNITQNREDAEDVLQEAFLKAYEHLDQFQGNSKFYTWIVRIAVNQALMKLRKRKTDRSVSLDEQIDTGEDTVAREIAAWDPDPEVQYSQDELNTILTEAIDGLAPIYRTVFTLRDVDGLSTEETAEALDLSVPAVKSRLLRARLQLRDKLTRFFKRKGDDAFAYM
jgi:RNA polymerase sigma-70 factor (ECF subfamily)